MSDQDKNVERDRECQAIIDTVLIGNPDLKDQLTYGAVAALWQLPDSSLGWTNTGEAMSPAIRRLAVIMHLRLEALPGFKHLLWLGNGFYPTAAFWKHRIGRAILKGELVSVTAPEFREFTDAEYRMFKIDRENDYSTVAMQKIKLGEYEQNWIGYGVIGTDELGKTDKNGKPLPGFQTKKNRQRTVRTRAMLDMATLNYAIEGVTVSAEDIIETQSADVQDVYNVTPTQQAQTPTEQIAAPQPPKGDEHEYAAEELRISKLIEKVEALGSTVEKVIERPDFKAWVVTATAAELHDLADALEEWVEANTEKPTPPPPKTKAAVTAPVAVLETGHIVDENGVIRTPSGRKSRATIGPDGKPRTRGKPPKTETSTLSNTTSETVVKSVTAEEITAVQTVTTEFPEAEPITLPEGVEVDQGEEFVFPEIPVEDDQAEADYFANHADQVEDNIFEALDDTHDDAVYTGSEAQKEKIRVMADAAGLKDNGSKFALAGAMKDQPMGALPKKIGAMMQNQTKPKEDSKTAQDRLKKALERVNSLGGAHMQITGTNTLNILDGGTVEAMNKATAQLEAWQPNRVAVELTRKAEAPSVTDFPKVPSDGPGAPSYSMLRSAFGQTKNDKILAKIIDLANRKLQGGDHAYIPAALRLAGKGDFKEMDALIAARELRR